MVGLDAGDALGARHRARARATRGACSAGAGFFFLYLPWGISPRTLNYSHYLFEAIPYACLSARPAARPRLGRRHGVPRARLPGASWSSLFLFFLPFLVALPVPRPLVLTSRDFQGVAPVDVVFRTWV